MAVRGWKYLLLLPAVALIGCDATGPGAGQARVFLSRDNVSAQALEGSDFVTAEGALTMAAIDSIWVTVTSVEVVPAGNDSTSGWQSLKLDSGSVSRINLMALPVADSTQLAQGELKEGKYGHIRLRINDSATIVLKQDVSVSGTTLPKGSYPLRIPSGQQTGLKIKTENFVMGNDSSKAVTLVFDAASSVGNVIVTGNGQFQMSPVLKSRN